MLIGAGTYLTLHFVEGDNFDGSSSVDILRTDGEFPQPNNNNQPTTIEKLYASESDADYFYQKLLSSFNQYTYQIGNPDGDNKENWEDTDDDGDGIPDFADAKHPDNTTKTNTSGDPDIVDENEVLGATIFKRVNSNNQDEYVWNEKIEDSGFTADVYYVVLDQGNNAEFSVEKISMVAGQFDLDKLSGLNSGSGQTETMDVTRISDTVIKTEGYDRHGNKFVMYKKLTTSPDGTTITMSALEFKGTNSNPEPVVDNSKVEQFKTATSLSELQGIGAQPFGTFYKTGNDAVAKYNNLFDTYGSAIEGLVGVAKKFDGTDDDGDPIDVAMWNRELDGKTIYTVYFINKKHVISGEQNEYWVGSQPELREISFSNGKATYKDANGNTVVEDYQILGSNLKIGDKYLNLHYVVQTGGDNQSPSGNTTPSDESVVDIQRFDQFPVFSPPAEGEESPERTEIEKLYGDQSTAQIYYDRQLENYTRYSYMIADPDNDNEFNHEDTDDDGDGVPDHADSDHPETQEADSDNDGIVDSKQLNDIDNSLLSVLPKDEDNNGVILTTTNQSRQELRNFIYSLHDWSDISRNSINAGLQLITYLLQPRDLTGGDLNQLDFIIDDQVISNSFANANAETFLKMVVKVNAIGDKRNSDKAEQLLNVFFKDANPANDSWIELSGDPHSGNNDLSTKYSHLLDGLLGNGRGKMNRRTSDRTSDLKLRDLEFDVDDINFRIISGHTVNIGGDFTDTHMDPVKDPKHVDLTIIASGRDTILTGDHLKIEDKSAPNVTDAYLIASADELYLRAEWNADTHATHYANPSKYRIDVENASLSLASVDDMHLINVDITTQGSLAIGTLDDLNIRSTNDNDPNVFKIGHEGVRNEGLFFYAKNNLSISDLDIQGKVDDIYMEAHTINLNDVNFPAMSAVLLRSYNGQMSFDGQAHKPGGVNFRNVRHFGVDMHNALNANHFDGTKSWAKTSSGRPRVEVQAYGVQP